MKDRKGFTLIEIIIAIAVLTVLILIATPRFLNYSMDARVAQIVNDVKVAQDIIGTHLTENDDTLPIEATEYLLEDLNQAIIDKKVFSTDGIVLSELNGNFRDTTDMSNIKNMKSKLDGRFVTSSTGIVYYIHTKSLGGAGETPSLNIETFGGFSFAFTPDGDVYAWGDNTSAALGVGDTAHKYAPIIHTDLSGMDIKKISSNGYHVLVQFENDDVYVWGDNWNGQSGIGDAVSYRTTSIRNDILSSMDIAEFIAGWDYRFAITTDNQVYAWGRNGLGELGLGDNTDKIVPTKNDFLSALNIKQIIAGYNESFALTEEGDVYTWGYNWSGDLGMGDTVNRNTPTKNDVLSTANIDYFVSTRLAVTTEGDYYVWGNNGRGELALGDFVDRSTPVKNDTLKGFDIQKLYYGGNHYVAITSTGDYYVWGNNSSGQLGLGDYTHKNVPIKHDALKALDIDKLSVGYVQNFAITADGDIYAWGWNGYGTLGLGDDIDRDVPTLLEFDFYQ